jgi:hypothetical protein
MVLKMSFVQLLVGNISRELNTSLRKSSKQTKQCKLKRAATQMRCRETMWPPRTPTPTSITICSKQDRKQRTALSSKWVHFDFKYHMALHLIYCWQKYIFPTRWQISEAKLIRRWTAYFKTEHNEDEITDENQFWFCQQATRMMYAYYSHFPRHWHRQPFAVDTTFI